MLCFCGMKIGILEHDLFKLSMWWRICYGTMRIILGLTLLTFIDVPLSHILRSVMRFELTEDPSDALFRILNSFLLTHPLSITYFLSAYLIFWGLIDIVLSINLLRNRIWAFPVSLWLIGVFILYELYRFSYTHSVILLAIIMIDIAIFWLIRHEYRKITPHAPVHISRQTTQ